MLQGIRYFAFQRQIYAHVSIYRFPFKLCVCARSLFCFFVCILEIDFEIVRQNDRFLQLEPE